MTNLQEKQFLCADNAKFAELDTDLIALSHYSDKMDADSIATYAVLDSMKLDDVVLIHDYYFKRIS